MNTTFVNLLKGNTTHAATFGERFDQVQDAQHPEAVTVCCADSRVLGDHLWGNEDPGRLFSCGNIGNRVVQRTATGDVVSGDVLYPIKHTGTELIIIVGHTGCGAVTAAYEALTKGISDEPGIEHCVELLKPSLTGGVDRLPENLELANAINRLVEYNVDQQIEFLQSSDEVPSAVDIVGVVYDFQDIYDGDRGEVHVINVDGERNLNELRTTHPDISDRIDRLWEY